MSGLKKLRSERWLGRDDFRSWNHRSRVMQMGYDRKDWEGKPLIAILNNYVEPGMGATLSYKGLAIIVLGGLGNVGGTLVASLLLGVVENLGSIYLTEVLDRDAIGFLFLIILLMIRPQGLVGK